MKNNEKAIARLYVAGLLLCIYYLSFYMSLIMGKIGKFKIL